MHCVFAPQLLLLHLQRFIMWLFVTALTHLFRTVGSLANPYLQQPRSNNKQRTRSIVFLFLSCQCSFIQHTCRFSSLVHALTNVHHIQVVHTKEQDGKVNMSTLVATTLSSLGTLLPSSHPHLFYQPHSWRHCCNLQHVLVRLALLNTHRVCLHLPD